MEMDSILEIVAESYSNYPLDFSCENDLQARLYGETRRALREDEDEELHTCWSKIWENPIRADHERKYVESYHDIIRNQVGAQMHHLDPGPLTRARTELPLWHPLSSMFEEGDPTTGEEEKILDFALLSLPFDRPIHIINGKHRYEVEMVDAAVELKFPRWEPKVPCSLRGRQIDSASKKELQNAVDLERISLKKDIEELEAIGVEYTTDTYIFLCSQYDVFRRGSTTTDRHDLLGDAAIRKLNSLCVETNLIYSYPGGWEWIVRN